jgi:DNA-binding NarL/FixJ family response regulator
MINVALAGDHALNLHALASLFDPCSDIRMISIYRSLRMLNLAVGEGALYPDVLVLDVNFELRPVVEAISRVKAARSSTRVIVLGLTRDEEAIGRMLQMGADHYLPKNIHAETLVETIRMMSERDLAGSSCGSPGYSVWPIVTDMEYRFLRLALSEVSNDEIRRKLKICESSFNRMVKQVYRRFEVQSRDGLAVALFRRRWIVRDDL